MSVFKVTALPAQEGDCLIVAYGADDDVRYIVIDAGHTSTGGALGAYLAQKGIRELELFVITHIDLDHIAGALNFLDDNPRLVINDIWFNGYRHLLEDLAAHGGLQGEQLTERLVGRAWNNAFDGHAVRVEVDGTPRRVPTLPGGLDITILSPDRAKLARLEPLWEEACRKAGLVAGQAGEPDVAPPELQAQGGDLEALANTVTNLDPAPANGSSIAFLMEYGGKRALFGADAHSDMLRASLARLGANPFALDLLKVPHHGSQANVTRALLAILDCSVFLISTNGARFRHPDRIAIARLITGSAGPAQIHFNYRQKYTQCWEDRGVVSGDPPFICHFVPDGEPTVISLL